MTSELLDALSEVDEGTICFLLDSLASFQAEECDWEDEVALVESLVEDPSHSSTVLTVLKADPSAVDKAKKVLMGRKEEDSSNNNPPYNVPHSPKLSQVKCTSIPGAQNRAISLRQLKDIYEYVEAQAEADGSLPWIDREESSATNGQRMHVKTINLYQLVESVVKPLTKSHQCSMVEIMATGPQKPRWFVSHAWAEPIHDFVTAISEHAKVRGLDDDTLYWICGYANNQHKIEEDIQANPKDTSFYRALQQSEGMLLCLDSLGTPFCRIWCCFEQAMIVEAAAESSGADSHPSSRNDRLLLDIATVASDGKAVVITDGRNSVAADMQAGPELELELKRNRESGFPLELLERGYEIDIRAAQSARDDDRRSILNTIAGSYGSCDEPDLGDPSFTRINTVLRGIFAEAAARKAAEAGRIDAVVRVLHEDTARRVLTLNLGGSEFLDLSALANLAGHISLQQLTIDCSYGSLPTVLGMAEGIAGLQRLELLVLKFYWCTTLKDVAALSEKGLSSLQTLKELRLDFTGCSFCVCLPRIEEAQSLERLHVNYSGTQSRANGKVLLGMLQLENLRELDLSFKGCRHVTHLSALKKIGQCPRLEQVSLDFSYTRLNDANELGALTSLGNLRQCTLSFTKCAQITSIPWLYDLASHGTEVEINLSECKGLDSVLQTHFLSRHDLLARAFGNPANSLLEKVFDIGEEVEYYSRTKREWLSAVVHKMDPIEIHLKIKGQRQNFPRKISTSEISPSLLRRKNGQSLDFKSESMKLNNGEEENPLCLLGKFHVGESVEYFARDWKKRWLRGTVTKVESEAIKIKVPGYNELRRVLSEEIPLKVRRPEKKP